MSTPDERLQAAVAAAGGAPRSDAQLDALARAARDELARRSRERAWWVDALVVLGLNLVLAVAAAASMSWNDEQHGSQLTKYLVASAWFVVMAVGSVWWLRPGPVRGRWAVLAGFGLASALTIFGASGFDPGGTFFGGRWCAMVECAIAVLPVALVVGLSLRFSARASHVAVGSLAAASGAALALHFHCPNGTVAHLAAFHIAPAVVLTGLAVLVRSAIRGRSFVP